MAETHEIPVATLPDGVKMPLVGFGTWGLRGQSGYDAIRTALDVGYRHIDSATMYVNESEVGRAIRDSGLDRGDVFVTTKLPPSNTGAEAETLATSLRALGTDYVDLWLVHWPPGGANPSTWREFIAAHQRGQARAIGVSNYSLAQIDELMSATGYLPAVNQVPWSPRRHDPQVLAGHRERGIALVGYSPLKRSDLADPALVDIAVRHRVTPAQVVLRWHLDRGIAIIPKSAQPERIAANFDLFGFTLTQSELDRVDRL
jgi:2,5-diketo-D-gluconate reductase A